jgi:manganese/zinc/iron transport system substrate-binding protein
MITDIVRAVAGDNAKVHGLMSHGVDPHLYKPTRNDAVLLQSADLIFYNGLLLEGKLEDILQKLSRSGKSVHALAESVVAANQRVAGAGASQNSDPHLRMDIGAWKRAVEVARDCLSAFDPLRTEEYKKNCSAYLAELEALEVYAQKVLGSIPEHKRVLVTAHDAFNYFGRAYGFEVRAIQGVSTESEAGMKDVENLVDFIVARQVPAVFVESSVSDKNVLALVEGAKAQGFNVTIGGELFSDAMGAPGTYEGTYIGMIDHNVTTIARALGGEAPEKGLHGKLGG